MLNFTDNIYKGFNANKETAAVFLDISRAFDRVWHKGLLFKLKCLGTDGPIFQWFCDYLTGRNQKVVLNGTNSSTEYVNAGVPQGSILAPLLFLIFINDFEADLLSGFFVR